MWNNGGYNPLGWAGGGQQYRQWTPPAPPPHPAMNLQEQAQVWAQHQHQQQMRGYWPQHQRPPPLPRASGYPRPPAPSLLGPPPPRRPLLGNPPGAPTQVNVRPPPPLPAPANDLPPPPPGQESEGGEEKVSSAGAGEKLNLKAPPPPPPPDDEAGGGYGDMDLEDLEADGDDPEPDFKKSEKDKQSVMEGGSNGSVHISPQLRSFDKMFSSWEENYEKWKSDNRNNPDRGYVASYTAQMEAMRLQLLEKRSKINMKHNWNSEDGRVSVKSYLEPPAAGKTNNTAPAKEMAKKILDHEEPNTQTKRSRWEEDMPAKKSRWESESSDKLDIVQMRRQSTNSGNMMPSNTPRFPFNSQAGTHHQMSQNVTGRGGFGQRGHYSQFGNRDSSNFQAWNPSQVRDYSNNRFAGDRDFKPQTFDYSHGGRGRGRGGARGNPAGGGGRGGFQPLRSSASPSPVPVVKTAGKVVTLESILIEERTSRPGKIVIILRGVPGAGKSHLARLIKEKEVEMGGEQPRTMALDDYFECDGEYEYEADMEQSYRANLLKSFKKNIDAGLFQFILVDAINDKVSHFREFWSYAKQNGYEVYICTVECDPVFAASRNIHKRTESEAVSLARGWEDTPPHINTLDVREFLQTEAIPHVEMTEAEAEGNNEVTPETSQNDDDEEEEEEDPEDQTFLRASKWEVMDKEEKLARLDGTGEKVRCRLAQHRTIEDWLELGLEETARPVKQGQKRVRWADIEQRKTQDRVAQFGFVVGQTNWASEEDRETAASSALTATKIIPSRWDSEFHN